MQFNDFEWVHTGLSRTELDALLNDGIVDESQVWTQVDADGDYYLITGIHYVNNLDFWVTSESQNDFYEIKIEE